jgi:hypothetical protein
MSLSDIRGPLRDQLSNGGQREGSRRREDADDGNLGDFLESGRCSGGSQTPADDDVRETRHQKHDEQRESGERGGHTGSLRPGVVAFGRAAGPSPEQRTSLQASHVGDAEPGAVDLGAWVGERDVDVCECPPVGPAVDPFLAVDLPHDAGADGDGGMVGNAAGVPVAVPVVLRPGLVDDALPQ